MPSRFLSFGSRISRCASEPWMQCIRRGYRAWSRRRTWPSRAGCVLSRSVTSSACRFGSCVKAILVWPPKAQAPHGHAMRAVHVRGNHQAAGLADQPVGGQHVDRRADLRAAFGQPVDGDVQAQQQQFQLADGGLGRKNPQDVEPERGGELKSRQDQDLVAQAAILIQIAPFLGRRRSLASNQARRSISARRRRPLPPCYGR